MGWITKFHDKPAYIDNAVQTPVWQIVVWAYQYDFDYARIRRTLDYAPFQWSEIYDALKYLKANPDEIIEDVKAAKVFDA